MTIPEYFVAITKILQCKFEMYGNSVPAEKVFSPEGMLPSLFKRAENLSLFVLNKPLGIYFEKYTQGMSGIKVTWDDTVPNSYRILCLLDILVELLQESGTKKIVRLDSLLYD
jgi:intracellular multiplication protein IcmS